MLRTAANPGRWFYRCLKRGSIGCDYFCWVNEYNSSKLQKEQEECKCDLAIEVNNLKMENQLLKHENELLKRQLDLSREQNEISKQKAELESMVSTFHNMRFNS